MDSVPTGSPPGEGLGLPAQGSGSVGGYGRRLLALFADWLLCLAVAAALGAAFHWDLQQRNLWTLVIFGVQTWLLTGLVGATPGKLLCGLRVMRAGGGRPGIGPAVVRTALLLLVLPALLWDRDHRGLHDKAAGTVEVLA